MISSPHFGNTYTAPWENTTENKLYMTASHQFSQLQRKPLNIPKCVTHTYQKKKHFCTYLTCLEHTMIKYNVKCMVSVSFGSVASDLGKIHPHIYDTLEEHPGKTQLKMNDISQHPINSHNFWQNHSIYNHLWQLSLPKTSLPHISGTLTQLPGKTQRKMNDLWQPLISSHNFR
jgi:hypothetical protein